MKSNDVSVYVYGLGTSDYLDAAYSDFRQDKDVLLVDRRLQLLSSLRKVHLSRKLEKKFHAPFRSIWARLDWWKIRATSEAPSVVLFLECPEVRCRRYVKWVRDKFPRSFFCLNLLNPMGWRDMAEWTSNVCDLFDLIITCSRDDADEFGFTYWPDCYSDRSIDCFGAMTNDLCFVGRDKGRSQFVWDVFQEATRAGFKCDFIVFGDKEGVAQYDGFQYLSEKSQMPYDEYLEHVMSSRALLEVLVSGHDYSSLRTMEALVYGKHLITTNRMALEEPIADSRQIHIVDNPVQVVDLLKDGLPIVRPSKEAIAFYSPLRLVDFLRRRSEMTSDGRCSGVDSISH